MIDRWLAPFAISLMCSVIPVQAQTALVDDPVKALVGRLDLEKFKAVVKGLTRFGDRQKEPIEIRLR